MQSAHPVKFFFFFFKLIYISHPSLPYPEPAHPLFWLYSIIIFFFFVLFLPGKKIA